MCFILSFSCDFLISLFLVIVFLCKFSHLRLCFLIFFLFFIFEGVVEGRGVFEAVWKFPGLRILANL